MLNPISPQNRKKSLGLELGRHGGLKSKARSDKLTSERKTEIARKAAKARWEKKQNRRLWKWQFNCQISILRALVISMLLEDGEPLLEGEFVGTHVVMVA